LTTGNGILGPIPFPDDAEWNFGILSEKRFRAASGMEFLGLIPFLDDREWNLVGKAILEGSWGVFFSYFFRIP